MALREKHNPKSRPKQPPVKPSCDCVPWLALGFLCGKPDCPRTIETIKKIKAAWRPFIEQYEREHGAQTAMSRNDNNQDKSRCHTVVSARAQAAPKVL